MLLVDINQTAILGNVLDRINVVYTFIIIIWLISLGLIIRMGITAYFNIIALLKDKEKPKPSVPKFK